MTEPRAVDRGKAPAAVATPLSVAEFEAHLGAVLDVAYRTAYHLTRSSAEAEALVQDAALRACKARVTFQRGSNFRPWFFGILTTAFYLKYPKRPTDEAMASEPPIRLFALAQRKGFAATPDPALTFTDRLDTDTISHALQGLPLEFRVVTTMHLVDDLPCRDIAHALDMPVGTVRSRLHRGRAMLKRSLWHAAVERGGALT